MRQLNAENIIGAYGPRWTEGILSEHLHIATRLVGKLRVLDNGTVLIVDMDSNSWPVLCSEVVPIRTEDGTITGRCGQPVIRNRGGDPMWCAGHDRPDWTDDCVHGMSAALCAGPMHYPTNY